MTLPTFPIKHDFATFAPLKIALAYLALTFAIAVAGPVTYVDFSPGSTALFLAGVAIAILVGYLMGVRSMETLRVGKKRLSRGQIQRVFDICLGIALFALVLSALSSLLSGTLNTNLSGLGEAYHSAYEGYERNSGNYSLFFLLYSFSLPFTFIASVWGMFYFSSLNNRLRILTAILVLGGLLFYVVGTGKQKQVGDVAIYLISIAAIKYGIRGRSLSFKLVGQTLAGGVAATALFIAVLGQRYAALNIGAFNINERVHPRMNFDIEHPIFEIFGMNYGFGLSVFSTYLSQGYYGLSLALNTDWSWTRLSGFSYSLSVILNRFLGFEWEWPNTLVYRVGATTGWGESKWHTVFPYFASDLTWLGTIILFGFFAYIYARSWLFSVRVKNPYAILMFTLLTMGLFFMPANNQMFHTPGMLFTVIVVSFFYLRHGHVPAGVERGTGSRNIARKGWATAFHT